MNSIFKAAPLLLAAGFALGGASAAHAQEFSFSTPTSSTLVVHPGDTVKFSGTFLNDQSEQLDGVTIGLSNTYPGEFTFVSLFFNDVAVDESIPFTGTLKVSSTATFTPTSFELDANGTGDDTDTMYNLTSDPFTIKLASPAAVPEASSLVSTGLLLTLGLGAFALRSRKRSEAKS